MIRFLLIFSLCALSLRATQAVDLLIDCEDSTATTALTTTILGNMTRGSVPGTWTLTANGSANMVVSSDQQAMLTKQIIGSVNYAGSGTRGITATQNVLTQYAQFRLTTPQDRMTFSCMVKIDTPTGNLFQTLDIIQFNNAAGGFFIAQFQNGEMFAHTDNGGSGSNLGSPISFSYGTWYLLTMDVRRAATCTLKLYTTAGVLVGTSTSATVYDSPMRDLRIGRCDAHGGTQPNASQLLRYDNLALDLTNYAYPLGYGRTYYVRTDGSNSNTGLGNTSGTAWLTIAKAMSTVGAGDTVRIQAGTYNESPSEGTDGSVGNEITYIADGEVNVTGGITLTSDYVRFIGLDLEGGGTEQDGFTVQNSNFSEWWFNDLNSYTRDAWRADNGTDTYRTNNSVFVGNTSDSAGTKVYNLIGSNNVFIAEKHTNVDHDTFYGGGSYNRFLSVASTVGSPGVSDHTDFIQTVGNSTPFYKAIIEACRYTGWAGENDHVFNVEANTGTEGAHISRGNSWRTIGSYADGFIDSASAGLAFYHNSYAGIRRHSASASSASSASIGGTGNSWFNNLFYNAWGDSLTTGISVYSGSSISSANYNLAYDPDGTVTFTTPFTTEANEVANQDPLFTNYAGGDLMPQAASPSVGAAGRLTTTTNSGTGTTFTVADGKFFRGDDTAITQYQGNLVAGEWITVGTDLVQVASVSGNSITVTAAFTWASGENVYWGADTTPDIGALPYKSGGYLMSSTIGTSGGVTTVTPADTSLVRFVVFIEDGDPVYIDRTSPYTYTGAGGTVTAKIVKAFASATPIVAAGETESGGGGSATITGGFSGAVTLSGNASLK